MAEKGAHLSPIASVKPSLFDVIAQETLNGLLYPVAKRISNVVTPNNALSCFTEFYYLTNLAVQFLHLKYFGATFSEKFYGLKRVPINPANTDARKEKILYLSLILEVLFPFLKTKLSEVAEKVSDEDQLTPNQDGVRNKLICSANNIVQVSSQVFQLIFQIRYLCGASTAPSLLHWLAGVKLEYANEPPFTRNQSALKRFFGYILPGAFGMGVFFIQFLQWWDTNKPNSLDVQKVPPPPQVKKETINVANDRTCPICNKIRYIDTVLATSGYVFCFKCISSYLMKNFKCPVTGLAATVDDLIHIYSPS